MKRCGKTSHSFNLRTVSSRADFYWSNSDKQCRQYSGEHTHNYENKLEVWNALWLSIRPTADQTVAETECTDVVF